MNIIEALDHPQRLSLLHHVTHPFLRGVLVSRLQVLVQEESDRIIASQIDSDHAAHNTGSSGSSGNPAPAPPPLPPPPLAGPIPPPPPMTPHTVLFPPPLPDSDQELLPDSDNIASASSNPSRSQSPNAGSRNEESYKKEIECQPQRKRRLRMIDEDEDGASIKIIPSPKEQFCRRMQQTNVFGTISFYPIEPRLY